MSPLVTVLVIIQAIAGVAILAFLALTVVELARGRAIRREVERRTQELHSFRTALIRTTRLDPDHEEEDA